MSQIETEKTSSRTFGRARLWSTFWALGLGLLLVGYQNCAPSSVGSADESGESSNPGVIDDVNLTTGVAFVESSIELKSSNLSFNAHGICSEEQAGARMGWSLVDAETNAVIDSGFADCEAGGFMVTVNDSQKLDCDQDHVLEARLGAGQEGTTLVVRRCEFLGSKPIQDAQMAAKGYRCFYEQSAAGDCQKSCYQTDVLRFSEDAPLAACVN